MGVELPPKEVKYRHGSYIRPEGKKRDFITYLMAVIPYIDKHICRVDNI